MEIVKGDPKKPLAFIVGDYVSEQKARSVLGPLKTIGVPVWINSRYASEKKAYTGAGPAFKKWIQQFTAHNEKLGYNSSVLKGGFVKQLDRIGLPESSRYNHFNDIYDRVFQNTGDYNQV